MKEGIDKVYEAESIEEIVGIEGFCAKNYFSIFNKLITNKKVDFEFQLRTKHPPLDPVNALSCNVLRINCLQLLNFAAIVFCVNNKPSALNLSICCTLRKIFPFVSPHTFAKNLVIADS